ncbi:hypothetical protein [Pseudarthrobacter sp. L1SW]|uniref:hypothetical protein n=1 Tax=Pseudarthrobacter sp. L1SW TaxID=2851598 RepID=UPI001E3981BD|nr:hypothetical protein [Pseudarthrobacter sp. L1SW]UEL29453.1 hypothetical protein KTR40_04825 [Pseudarthrobacter sp. L1SW]
MTAVKGSHRGLMSGTNRDRDHQVRTEHERVLARGEKRSLTRTVDGTLPSYAQDEMGIVNAGSQPAVRTATGFMALAAAFVVDSGAPDGTRQFPASPPPS